MPKFTIQADFTPTGDQPEAIAKLSEGVLAGLPHQTLLGVTGSGKTFTIANVIARTGKPALVMSHNKTLAYQLYEELKSFLPDSSVHYFVSYYDYYQPEAYIPQTDTYIDKDVKINEELDRLRHEATQAILSRDDTIVVASISCIYNIGSPENYKNLSLHLSQGQHINRNDLLKHLVSLQYQRNEVEKMPGIFKAKGESIEIYPSTGNEIIKLIINKDIIEQIFISEDYLHWKEASEAHIFPAKYWLSETKTLPLAIANIESELAQRLEQFKKENKLLEYQRLEQRTRFDLEMLKSMGWCHGIENYSGHIEFRPAGSPPYTLFDYFKHAYKDDFIIIADESHMTIPQVKGMYAADRARKDVLVEYGFRLPSARDNRPLTFAEFENIKNQRIYMSATPALYELEKSAGHVAEQLVRPTGLLDPQIEVRKTEGQIEDVIVEIQKRVTKKQRVLVTVLTKRMAEDLTDFLKERDVSVQYIHSEVKTFERTEILRDLRLGQYDVIVGVNLLREGLDLPEVSLVIIMDADKEGFLRNRTTLIQTMGRAARHVEGNVIMYADKMTDSMKQAISETKRRRKAQEIYNKQNNITPIQISKTIHDKQGTDRAEENIKHIDKDIHIGLLAKTHNIKKLIADYTKQMKKAATEMDFEKAQEYKDIIAKLKKFT